MRFPHCRCLPHDTLLRSILLPAPHRRGMLCARTFSCFDSPLHFALSSSVQLLPSLSTASLDRAPFAAQAKRPFRGAFLVAWFLATSSSQVFACSSPNIAVPLSHRFPRLLG